MGGANSFGSRFILSSFGESHGSALGALIDGVPAGIPWNEKLLLTELARRRPGTSNIVSARAEQDLPEVLSGVYQNKTLGTPILILVRNHDAKSVDYKTIAKKARPGHADDVWKTKFAHSDPRGGGRSSGRETVARVMGGAVAKMLLAKVAPRLKITGFADAIGPFSLETAERELLTRAKKPYPADAFVARFPSQKKERDVEKLLLDAKTKGHSYGGIAEIWVDGLPAGLGQPVFHKLKADLASALMSVGATSAFEIGDGFASAQAEGSKFHKNASASVYGGLRGGISTGERLTLRCAFKPTSSVLDVAKKGRHDPCIVPRALVVLESMVALTLADHWLWSKTDRV